MRIVWYDAFFLSEMGRRYVDPVARVASQMVVRCGVRYQPCLSKVSFDLWVAT
jgi:hypothetical protein